ncbi:MAG: LysM peptidoglycan-binding domain-containing protein [Pseudonocardia sp.]
MTRSPFRVDQPQPNDLVGDPLLVAGTGGGFEATIDIRILDGTGRALLETSTLATNLLSAWQARIDLPNPPPTPRGVIEVAPSTGADEAEARVSVPVFFGTAIAPGFRSYLLHVVQPGETLSGIAASEQLFIGGGFEVIFEANRDILADPNRIQPGQVLRIPADF